MHRAHPVTRLSGLWPPPWPLHLDAACWRQARRRTASVRAPAMEDREKKGVRMGKMTRHFAQGVF
eukprot:CAMPEP_0195068642 /NCGR_PEP_ID=MMETSP0448-20130528/13270_1 /TAXON_ID=66468 /ORGANISM="Heterocapsa triquestra, Strain CCMP 448" /LENGTH=64 /DNA_ID=CAMNT_0040100181 /DNA_START=104 /DNA_END=295 /DNA_ORIENTATION=-